jgi:hypothetical protein
MAPTTPFSRKDSGLTPTAVFALATPKAPLIGVGDGNQCRVQANHPPTSVSTIMPRQVPFVMGKGIDLGALFRSSCLGKADTGQGFMGDRFVGGCEVGPLLPDGHSDTYSHKMAFAFALLSDRKIAQRLICPKLTPSIPDDPLARVSYRVCCTPLSSFS